MLHMLRAGSVNQAQQCGQSAFLMRYALMMKMLNRCLSFAVLGMCSAQVFAQPEGVPERSNAAAGLATRSQAVDPQKAPGHKDGRADLQGRRGRDLRLALTPQNTNVNGNLKMQGGLENVADSSTPDSSPEHHLNVKQRQEMRELLRQQRLKQQQN